MRLFPCAELDNVLCVYCSVRTGPVKVPNPFGTLCSVFKDFIEKLAILQVIKELATFGGARILITVFTRVGH